MATNQPRHGHERKRSQLMPPGHGKERWTKRDDKGGQFMTQKKTPEKFKKHASRASPLKPLPPQAGSSAGFAA